MAMDYYGKYKNIIQVNSTDSVISANKDLINDNFNQAFFSEMVLVDGIEFQSIVKQEKKSEDKKLIFKPDTKINVGSVVKIGEVNYLIFDFLGEGINEVYPTAKLKLCNSTYPIKSNKTRVLKGHNTIGKPIYEEVYEIDTVNPCIVESRNYVTDTNAQLIIPNNSVLITLKHQPSETIAINYEFTMYNNKYKITDIDYTKVINDKGIIKIIAERV